MEHVTFSIVLPTYNEKENLQILIPDLLRVFNDSNVEIIIVDDGSQDGTRSLIKEFQHTRPNITLVERHKLLGIGSALIEGYRRSRGTYILSCDSDLSFSANDLRRIGNALQDGRHDLVLGSRHISGAYYEAPGVQILKKKIISKIGNFFLHSVTRIPTHDFSANCRGIKKEVWSQLVLMSQTNFMLFEMIWRTYELGFNITEIPVQFLNRKFGSSKLKLEKEVFTSLCLFIPLISKFYLKKISQLFRASI